MRARPRPFLRRLARHPGGAVTLLGAGSLLLCMGCLAFAVDLGSLYVGSRRLQGIADAAALSAAGNLGNARAAADAAVAANGWPAPYSLTVTPGAYRPDPSIAVPERFTADATDPDAARVTIETEAPLFFGAALLGHRSVRIRRTATAARANLASFSIGSRLLALEGGIGNALLGALTGSNVSLSVMDYDALLGADVDLFAFSKALQTQLDLQAVSFDTVLATRMSTGTALQALAAALEAGGSASAASAVRKLLASAPGTGSLQLDSLIDLGPAGAQDHVIPGQSVQVNAFDMLRSMLQLANGARQIQLDLGATVPGLTGVMAKISVGDRMADSPWVTVTRTGQPVISTAQTRLYLEANVLPAGNLLGIASVRVPLYVELAEARANLAAIDCGSGRQPRGVTLAVRPSIGHASIADIFPADIGNHRSPLVEGPARLVSLPLLSVSGQARVDLTGQDAQSVSFDATEIAAHTVKTVSSESLVQGLALSLINQLNLTVSVGGLGLGTQAVGSLVGTTLSAAAPTLDGVVNALTGLLGIHLGQADVRVNGVRCGVPALVA